MNTHQHAIFVALFHENPWYLEDSSQCNRWSPRWALCTALSKFWSVFGGSLDHCVPGIQNQDLTPSSPTRPETKQPGNMIFFKLQVKMRWTHRRYRHPNALLWLSLHENKSSSHASAWRCTQLLLWANGYLALPFSTKKLYNRLNIQYTIDQLLTIAYIELLDLNIQTYMFKTCSRTKWWTPSRTGTHGYFL